MICYLESKSDTVLKVCSAEKFAELTEDQRTAVLIDAYRSGQNPGAKQMLPAFVFQGYDPALLEGKRGSRKKSALKPTGLVMHDFDHINNPQEVYDKFLSIMPKLGLTLEHDLALAHVTPSGKGLRLVLRSRKNRDVAEDQKWIADALGVECDVHVKDLSRLSFVPKREDILYYNAPLLFAPIESYAKAHEVCSQPTIPTLKCEVTDGNVAPQQAGAQGTTAQAYAQETNAMAQTVTADSPHGSGAATSPSVTPYGATAECGDETDTTSNNRAASTTPSFPECYNGIPYKRIVEELIIVHGGQPQIGNRENTLFLIAGDMAKITDRSQTWLESLLPTFGLPEEEWRTTIAQVCKKPMERGLSRKLQEAIKRCKDEMALSTPLPTGEGSGGEALPPALPAKLPSLVSLLTSKVLPHQRPAVAAMIFPALATHVNNCKFKLKENTDVELSLMSCLLAPQSAGKGCVKQPLKYIMQDIKAEDKVNRQREHDWQESQKNKKANEKGKSRPDDIVIRILSSDTTPAAFLGRLQAAERGDGIHANLCTYSQVDEIEDLYRFCSGGGKNYINQMIKRSWDRDDIGAERWSSNSANISTVLRWNWAASSTIDGGKNFFRRCLTDGTTSRVDFCTIITPEKAIDFCYGDYDADFRNSLKPYIENLKKFSCEKDEDGEVIPMVFPRIIQLEGQMNDYINETSGTMPDNTWVNYAWRTKEMAIKKLITLYIANGCEWEEEFEPFVWWSFHYSMWCKMNLFYEEASKVFGDEHIVSDRGHRSPLKFMRRTFSYTEFAQTCQQQGYKQKPDAIIRKYKQRGIITYNPDKTYTINPQWAKRFGIV